MKKVIFSGILIFSSVILLSVIQLSTSNCYAKLSEWPNFPGKYFYAISESGNSFLFFISIILLVVGIIIGTIGCIQDNKTHN